MVANSSTPPEAAKTAYAQPNLRNKFRIFLITNVLVILLVITALALNPYAQLGTGVYVIILFILCSLPLLFMTDYRGKATLMLMYMAYYFAAFGLLDLSNLVSGIPVPPRSVSIFFTGGEVVILISALAFLAGYALAAAFISKRSTGIMKKDWSPGAITLAGVIAWIIGFYTNALVQLGVGDQFTLTKYNLGAFGGFIVLARILGPVGFLMLAYSYLTTGKKSTLIVLIVMMLGDFFLGFVGDTKEMAIRDPLLFLFSYVILRERIPVVMTVIFVVAAGLAFNFFAAYRDELGTRHQSRISGLSNLDSKLDNILSQDKSLAKRFSEGLEYFSTRITLKQNVEILVARLGKDREFQEGYTLKPLLFAFIPRFILPNKQDTSDVGRQFNREFFHYGSRDTYISVSTVGELYWNYGYTGIIVGMICNGLLLAYIAGLTLGEKNNLPRYLLLLLTVYLLVLRSESSIAMTYTFWMRTVVLLFFIHMIMPKKQGISTKIPPPSVTRTPMLVSRAHFTKPGVK